MKQPQTPFESTGSLQNLGSHLRSAFAFLQEDRRIITPLGVIINGRKAFKQHWTTCKWREKDRKRDFPQHQIQKYWGTELKIIKVEQTSYAKTHFSPRTVMLILLILLAHYCVIMALELHTTFIPNLSTLQKQL